MTKEEYEALVDEYEKTDSISRRKEIEEKIEKAGIALFNRVRDIYDTYHARKELITDDDYREDRGWIGLAHEDDGEPIIGKGSFLLYYGDRWAYGGECGFGIRVYAKWFNPEVRKGLANDLKAKRIVKLENEIESSKQAIAYQENRIIECREEISKLNSDEDYTDEIETEDE